MKKFMKGPADGFRGLLLMLLAFFAFMIYLALK